MEGPHAGGIGPVNENGADSLYGAAEQGAGGFLSGVVARPREFVALWGVEC